MKRVFLFAGLAVVAGWGSVICAHDVKGKRFLYDPVDRLIEGQMIGDENLYEPSLARTGGKVFAAMLKFTRDEGDRIVAGEWREDGFAKLQTIVSEAGQYRHPTLTTDASGRLWLSYETLVGERWQVRVLRGGNGLEFESKPIEISRHGRNGINHRVAAMPGGPLAFVWQGDHEGQWDVLFRRLAPNGKPGEMETLSTNPLGDWHPSIAAGQDDGQIAVAWDAYDGDSFSVRTRLFGRGKWGNPIRVTDSRAFEGRAEVAFDGGGELFVTWEEGAINWGQEHRGPLKDSANTRDDTGPVHRYRLVRTARIEPGGKARRFAFPMPTVPGAANREGALPGRKRLGVFYERPKPIVDESGRLWIVYRHYYYPEVALPGRPTSHVEEGWRLYARRLSDEKWSEPIGLEPNQRDGMQKLALLPSNDGFRALWTTGRTHRGKPRGPRGVAMARVHAGGSLKFAAGDASEASAPSDVEKSMGSNRREPAFEPAEVGGKRYQLFLGDLHRHTDLSLCRVYYDGTLDDAYRYAIEAAGLDYVGITDHSRDIANGDALSQLWWRSVKEVTRHRLEGTFFPLFAFERSHGETDHNVISLRSDMLRPYQPPLREFWKIMDGDTITIPHNPIRPARTFTHQDDARRPLVEYYQGCRDNPMTDQVHFALKRGFHMGFIASSDHMATRTSYACVWAPEGGEEPIFRSLQARRTYGATDKIRLVFRTGEHWMGEILEVDSMPAFQFEVDGTAPIAHIHVVRDAKVVQSFKPAAGSAPSRMTGSFGGEGALTGDTWLYIHVVQKDGEHAWSSPIWLKPPPSGAPKRPSRKP